jgi:hypothetical protein
LELDVAYEVMVVGMTEGAFTNNSLQDWLNAEKVDFLGARRIINGTDKASLVAQYAQEELGRIAA